MSKIKQAQKSLKSLLGIKYHNIEQSYDMSPYYPDNGDDTGNSKLKKLAQSISPHLKSKKDIYERYTKLKEYHLVESVLCKVETDILHKGRTDTQPLISISHPDEGVKETAEKVVKRFNLETFLEEDLFDLLLYGEYYLKSDFENDEIDDCYDYMDILPIYSKGEVRRILKRNEKRNTYEESEEIEPKDVIIFRLPGTKFKLDQKDKSGSRYYIKISSPFIKPNVIRLLNYLKLMEVLIPLSQLKNIDQGQIVNVAVPPGTPVGQIFEITKEYEKKLNSMSNSILSGVTDFEDVEDIISNFGKYKAIPSLGNKASMNVRDAPTGKSVGERDMKFMVETVADRLGVPLNYVTGGVAEQSRDSHTLYLRKLKGIRESLAESVKSFIIGYFEYRREKHGDSVPSNLDKLEVKLPTVPGTESLESVDYLDAISGTLSNVQRVIEDFEKLLMDAGEGGLDKEQLVDHLNKQMRPIIGGDIFNGVPKKKEGEDGGRRW